MVAENQGHLEGFLIKEERTEDFPFSFHLPLIFFSLQVKADSTS